MKTLIPTLATAGLLIGLAVAPAGAQGIPGTGGAKAQGMPSTVGVDPRPDRETMKARRPTMQAIQADRGYHGMYRHHGYRHTWRHHHRTYGHSHMRHDRYGEM